jgi:hypothetical protein
VRREEHEIRLVRRREEHEIRLLRRREEYERSLLNTSGPDILAREEFLKK